MKKLKSISLDDAISKDIGEKGTPERDSFDRKVSKEVSEETIKNIMDFVKSPEMRRFSSLYIGNHLCLIQDFNRFETPHVDVSHSFDDEHDWLIHIGLFCWSMEISWNGRKESWGILAKVIYTLIGIVLIWGILMLLIQGIYYIDRGSFFEIDKMIAAGVGIMAVLVSVINKLRKMLKNL